MFQLFHTSRPGRARHLARLHRQHQQPAHDERRLQPRRAAGAWRKRWGKETLAGGELNNKQFNDYVASGPLAAVLRAAGTVWTPRVLKDGVRLGRRAGRAQPRLSQYRPVQRGMAAALQCRSSAASRSRRSRSPSREPIRLIGRRPRRRRRRRRCSSCKADAAAPAEGRAGRRDIPDHGPGGARPRQDGLRRDLRALPLQQAARSRRRGSIPTAAPGPDYLDCWNKYWAWTKTDEFKKQMREIVAAARLPRRQLPVDRGRACR